MMIFFSSSVRKLRSRRGTAVGGDRVRTDAIISAVKLENAINSTQSLRRNEKEESAHIVSSGGGVTYFTVIVDLWTVGNSQIAIYVCVNKFLCTDAFVSRCKNVCVGV